MVSSSLKCRARAPCAKIKIAIFALLACAQVAFIFP